MWLCVDAGRPIAAEAGISRRRLAKWYARWRTQGEDRLLGHSSRPSASLTGISEGITDLVEALRRQITYGPARLAAERERLHVVIVAPTTPSSCVAA
ncbi:helix-turn-helix domain-containing protein [Streptomyces sp. NPDC046979]|uniref:helix-turn-helix domain-containing protein n=1 Tax=Streptomyces sp. NPDC046979 TaxID=3154604 RepID=UPI00341181F0